MTVYFSNKGALHLDTIRTMGVSVKVNDNPLGYFGTGLKFAIATLLRTGHRITLLLEGEPYHFTTKEQDIRGQTFEMVYMNDEKLAFTTDLGKNWKVWQAYRELYSNCLDENGTISRHPVEQSDTIFRVDVIRPSEENIDTVHDDRGKLFLMGEPDHIVEGLEIYPGKSSHLYYRGVRVADLPVPSLFTYNLTVNMLLTEDRTLASMYDAGYKISSRLPRIDKQKFQEKLIGKRRGMFEDNLTFTDCFDPAEAYLDALEKFREELNDGMKAQLKKNRKWLEDKAKNITLDDAQKAIVEEAKPLLLALGVLYDAERVRIVDTLGIGIEGMYSEEDGIAIAVDCLNKGAQWFASTVYEEYIHKTHGYADCTRGMQQFLFDRIMQLVNEKVNG